MAITVDEVFTVGEDIMDEVLASTAVAASEVVKASTVTKVSMVTKAFMAARQYAAAVSIALVRLMEEVGSTAVEVSMVAADPMVEGIGND
ncbi:MAG TPA: hypothetical protein VGI34_00785 [Candidatus Acidoferrales bacterium]|jgi:hypothetical protein